MRGFTVVEVDRWAVSAFIPAMRAAILYGKEDLRVEEAPDRDLAPGEIRVRIEAALTCGTDLKVFKRGYHARMLTPPSAFGHELAGVVSEVHGAAKDWSAGDRVVVANSAPCGNCFFCQNEQENLCDDLLFLNGAYAESILVPERLVRRNTLRLKAATAFADAALAEPLACVVQGLRDLDLRAGQRVLILGAGPIGLMFAALARHQGCETTVAGRGAERLAAARTLGARALDLAGTQTDLATTIRAFGGIYDSVVEAVGQPEVWEAAVQLVRKGGSVNFFGGCPSGTRACFDTGLIHYSNLRLLASFHHTPKTFRRALEYIEEGVVRARDFVTGQCRLEKLPDLFASMARGNRAVKTLVQTQVLPA